MVGDIGHNTTSLTNTATAADVHYNITYDKFGNRDVVKVGNSVLSNNDYAANNGNLLKTTYGNGFYKSYGYDNLDRVTTVAYNGSSKFQWQYGANGQMGLHKDLQNGMEYRYEYDTAGRLTYEDIVYGDRDYTYDGLGRLSSLLVKHNTTNLFTHSHDYYGTEDGDET